MKIKTWYRLRSLFLLITFLGLLLSLCQRVGFYIAYQPTTTREKLVYTSLNDRFQNAIDIKIWYKKTTILNFIIPSNANQEIYFHFDPFLQGYNEDD